MLCSVWWVWEFFIVRMFSLLISYEGCWIMAKYFKRQALHTVVWVQQHCHKYKSQVCNNLSDVMSVLTTNKTHHIKTRLCVASLCLEVNVCVTLWSYLLTQVSECVQKQVIETQHTQIQETVTSTWFRRCDFKVTFFCIMLQTRLSRGRLH